MKLVYLTIFGVFGLSSSAFAGPCAELVKHYGTYIAKSNSCPGGMKNNAGLSQLVIAAGVGKEFETGKTYPQIELRFNKPEEETNPFIYAVTENLKNNDTVCAIFGDKEKALTVFSKSVDAILSINGKVATLLSDSCAVVYHLSPPEPASPSRK